jgi:hypothetical protein
MNALGDVRYKTEDHDMAEEKMSYKPSLIPGVPDGLVLRRARRSHRCATFGDRRGWDHEPLPPSHTPVIEPGEYHIEYVGESPAFQAGPRYCLSCAVAAGLLRPRTAEDHERRSRHDGQ